MRYHFSIDRGGTFTDCILDDQRTGQRHVTKVLSGPLAPIEGIRKLLNLSDGEPVPPCDVRMGTTVATNALLERAGVRTGLLITRGFRDLLHIGNQTRPDLFDLRIRRPPPLPVCIVELAARCGADGNVLDRPCPEEISAALTRFAEARVTSIAIAILHSYKNPQLERELETACASRGFAWVFPSYRAANELGFLERTSTAVLDAYLTPLLQEYLQDLEQHLPGSRLRLMQSSGGLCAPRRLRGVHSLLSGPAGGIIAARRLRERASGDDATPPRLITFDMGGTSTDVALVREGDERKFETEIDGVWVRAPMMDIHTVAAGGGSICSFDGQALTVGPHSAGANPGPLCYGKPHAQEITLTDINVALGLLPDDHFPFPLDRSRAELALRDLASKVSASRGEPTSSERLALGFREVASTRMAEAIRQVTVARGQDARNCELLVFGGAGGQHACAVARALGVNRIRCHVLSGVLSAFGIGLADESWTGDVDGGGALLDAPGVQSIGERLQVLADQGRKTLHRDSQSSREPTVHLSVELRYCGTNSSIVVPFHDVPEMIRCFERSHQEQFGFLRPGTAIEIFAGRVDCLLGGRRLTPKPTVDPATGGAPESTRRVDVLLDRGGWQPVPVFQLEEIRGGRLSGPALILSPTGSMVVEADFDARLVEDELVLERRPDAPSTPQREDESTPDVALLEVMAARFSSIAEQMGQALRRSASSTNIRDRLDFSCAMFDSAGRLVANAPHIPVHLGAMSESVAATIRRHPHPHPGDVFVTNDPALGGSHLPDITVITPVFDELGGLNFFVASRGHHADVGGKAPGSMPADSRHINEEGVVFSAELMVSDRQFREAFLRTRLASGPYPARRPEENLGDLRAQAAANQLGQRLLGELCDEYGIDIVKAYMAHLHERARRQVRAAISRLPNGTMQFSDCLDDGARIEVRMTKRDGKLVIDFDGTSPQVPTNFNAPRAVTVAAVLYFLRSLLSESLPLNEGCLDPIELNIPAGSLLCPSADRAVAAGNVETSQRIVDVLLGAAGVAAASQGTMNNLSFGNDGFGYYETIAGGAGATADCRGADGVQTHMTNTRITDVEVLESRFPVRVMEFSLRRGSGGAGAQRGGDGVVRELELLAPLSVEVLSSRRACPPFGLAGGSPGQPGRNFVDGKLLPGCFGRALSAGARLRLETPGGGGYGDRSNANEKK